MIRPLLAALPLLAACTTEPAHDPHLPAVEVEVRRLTERIDEVLEHDQVARALRRTSAANRWLRVTDPREGLDTWPPPVGPESSIGSTNALRSLCRDLHPGRPSPHPCELPPQNGELKVRVSSANGERHRRQDVRAFGT